MKARKFTRRDLLNQDYKTKGRNKLVFNFTYHQAYSKLKHTLSNINLLLTSDAQHRQVFPEVPIVGVKRGNRKKIDGKSCSCQGKRCELCTFLEENSTFTNKEDSDTYKIRSSRKVFISIVTRRMSSI